MTRLRSHLLTFILLLAVAFVGVALDQNRRLNAPQDWGQRLTLPAETGLSGATRAVGGWFGTLRNLNGLQAENETLRRQIEQLRLVNVQLIELQKENERLRALVGFREENPNYTLEIAEIVAQEAAATVIGGEPSNLIEAVRIDQGRESGVEPGMSVITASGLVGRVQESGEGWAKVVLLTDPSSRVTAIVQQSRASGVVEGTGSELVMRYIPHEQRVEPGDVVLSAGLGGQFPRGLPIGVVATVERSDTLPWQEATVRSTLDFAQLETVWVIRSFVETPDAESGGGVP